MKTILFYYPSNKRSVQIETTLIELKGMGHDIILLTTCKKGALHEILTDHGILCFSNEIKKTRLQYYFTQIIFLISFVKRHKVDVVFGNLQHTNMIAVFSQYFFKAPVIVFRHHFKFSRGKLGVTLKVNKNELLFDQVINLLAKKIIVPSSGVRNGMINFEKANSKKIQIIPYIYDFKQYGKPDLKIVQQLKAQYPCRLRIIMVARLIPFKRHILALEVYKNLIKNGLDIQVLILDEGPERVNIDRFIIKNKLESKIHLIGYTTNFLSYMEACDLLIHPSLTEASNNVVKEIGLLKKAVAVCKNVGDFDEYIIDQKNGFLLDIENTEEDIQKVIEDLYGDKNKLQKVGESLSKTIINKFTDNSFPISLYKDLLSKI